MNKDYKRVLIYHIGSLGDVLVAVPALWVIRETFPKAKITLLISVVMGKNHVMANDVLNGSGIVDEIVHYKVRISGKRNIFNVIHLVKLAYQIRRKKYDSLVYLIREYAGERRIVRDLLFFRIAGITNVIGDKGFFELPRKKIGEPLLEIPHQSDQLLARLSASGIQVPQAGCGRTDVNISIREKQAVENWLETLPYDGGRKWVGIGIGGKQPVTRWPLNNYGELIKRIIDRYDIWPFVFGGSENDAEAKNLIKLWKRGYINSGLSIRVNIAALSRCALFIGNDTGTMHMATSAGIPRLGIYSSHDYPGEWYPYGSNKLIIRKSVPCEGCRQEDCYENKKECLLFITVEDVIIQARDFIAKHLS